MLTWGEVKGMHSGDVVYEKQSYGFHTSYLPWTVRSVTKNGAGFNVEGSIIWLDKSEFPVNNLFKNKRG